MELNNKITIAVVVLCMGLILGMTLFLTIESKAISYLSDDSTACANCHPMLSAYNTWAQSAHRRVAQCVDCHIPHENIVRKYTAKASDGARHTYAFTTKDYPEVIRATEVAKSTIQHNCIRCHEPMLLPNPSHNTDLISGHRKERLCWTCHREVPHGRATSISAFTGTGVGQAGQRVSDFITTKGGGS